MVATALFGFLYLRAQSWHKVLDKDTIDLDFNKRLGKFFQI